MKNVTRGRRRMRVFQTDVKFPGRKKLALF